MSDLKRGGAQLAEAVKKAYELGQDDYHLEPMLLVEDGKPVGKIGDGDSVVFAQECVNIIGRTIISMPSMSGMYFFISICLFLLHLLCLLCS